MKEITAEGKQNDSANGNERPLHRVRLPGFITEEEIGLGEVIKRATSYVGIQPCASCARRATALSRWLVFTGRHQNKGTSFARNSAGSTRS